MSPFLTNLLLFSPLLFLAAIILYVLDRVESLRRLPPEQPPQLQDQDQPEVLEDEGDEAEDLLAALEAGYDGEPGEEILGEGEGVAEVGGGGEGPADWHEPTDGPVAPQPQRAPRTRTVGAKKARSLARRDQRRAYHEFLHSQQSERARQVAETEEEEEERVFREKQRRAALEEEIAERKKVEKEARVRAEREEEEKRRRDVDAVRGMVMKKGGRRAWKLEELASGVGRGVEWVSEMLRKDGLVGGREGEWRMFTAEGWYVIVGERELGVLYRELERKGKMEWGEMARVLEQGVVA